MPPDTGWMDLQPAFCPVCGARPYASVARVQCPAGHEWYAADLTEDQQPPEPPPARVDDVRAIQLDEPDK